MSALSLAATAAGPCAPECSLSPVPHWEHQCDQLFKPSNVLFWQTKGGGPQATTRGRTGECTARASVRASDSFPPNRTRPPAAVGTVSPRLPLERVHLGDRHLRGMASRVRAPPPAERIGPNCGHWRRPLTWPAGPSQHAVRDAPIGMLLPIARPIHTQGSSQRAFWAAGSSACAMGERHLQWRLGRGRRLLLALALCFAAIPSQARGWSLHGSGGRGTLGGGRCAPALPRAPRTAPSRAGRNPLAANAGSHVCARIRHCCRQRARDVRRAAPLQRLATSCPAAPRNSRASSSSAAGCWQRHPLEMEPQMLPARVPA